jgi:DNA-binding transcriptional ArsR family regulator
MRKVLVLATLYGLAFTVAAALLDVHTFGKAAVLIVLGWVVHFLDLLGDDSDLRVARLVRLLTRVPVMLSAAEVAERLDMPKRRVRWMLQRLEDQGLVRSSEEPGSPERGGFPRRVYVIRLSDVVGEDE